MSAPALAQESIVGLVAAIRPGVVTITTYDSSGQEVALASGFFISRDIVVTNWHVLKGASSARVKTYSGAEYPMQGVVSGDQNFDLVEIRVNNQDPTVTPLTVTAALPAVGARIVVIGAPIGLQNTVSDGIVSAIRNIENFGQVIQITAPVSEGSSGSPVVNLRGQVVGVVRATVVEGQNLNFAIPSAKVLDLKPGIVISKSSSAGFGAGAIASGLVKAGWDSLGNNDYASALKSFRQAVQVDPSSYEGWGGLGWAEIGLGNLRQAADAFRKSIQLKPDYEIGYLGLGMVYLTSSDYDNARKAFETVIMINPSSAVGHYGLGLVYVATGDKASALSEYSVLKKLDTKLALDLFRQIYKK